MSNIIETRIAEALEVLRLTKNTCTQETEAVAKALVETFTSGGKLLICGNGGSAADAQHIAAEFVSSFSVGLARQSLPAIALSVDTSILTAISNDFDFDLIFSRQIEGLGKSGDSVLIISTSGESRNCLKAYEKAKELGITTLALTRQNSSLYRSADHAIGIPSDNTQHIQESHIVLYHCIAEIVELAILKEGIK